ncbi:aminopeptidase N [Parashewanella spongiae]|uniref:Aminopeptidase N n=1 Tax=Parashewanella spongiae TaxID=342950 RepID=A0A3A6TST8_9GAMM|nr:aminopeptidase N [Parashewanella spongiae]MCL1078485.1 aminopeptidase N [Parashewanella spongiae]RJY14668.1 aminopeptidase N [Parashewanella spongiae]
MSQLQAKYLKDYSAPDFTIDHIQLNFDLNEPYTYVTAISQVVKKNKEATRLELDGNSLELVSVKINNNAVEHQILNEKLIIQTILDSFELEIITKLEPGKNTSLEGLYLSDGAYCTQCEAEGFRCITYYLDRPDVLAKFDVRIEADKEDFPFLLSNGNLLDKGELNNGRHFASWQDPYPKPSYLFALVAGDFDQLKDSFTTRSAREVELQVFVDKGNLNKANHAMASLKKSMEWDETRFNLEYDLDIYMIVAVDFFNMGAMENKGLNVFNTKYVLADTESATDQDFHGIESVIGHEYFHNWTGNRVTCRDWFQLSLKEGLTVFRDQEFSSDVGSRAVNRIHAIKVVRNQQFAEDAGPMAHPIRPESVIEMNNFYTVTVYDKGAEVIRMMHTLLGETKFQKGMELYFKRHDGQAVTCDDFVSAMETASGVDLRQFRLWYSQAGTPIVTVSEEYNEQTRVYKLVLSQNRPTVAGNNTEAMHIPFDIELIDSKGNSLFSDVLSFTEQQQIFTFEGIDSQPTASLLQNFSAPVKIDYEYTADHLAHLMRYATNEVARWEASVSLFSKTVWGCVAALENGQAMQVGSLVQDAFRGLILDPMLDPALIAEVMNLPSVSELIEQVSTVDLDKLLLARQFTVDELGVACEDELNARYHDLKDQDTVQARALKNACLYWLSRVGEQYEALIEFQFMHADNMTDSLAALKAASNGEVRCYEVLMARFEEKWNKTPLVMDKWFMLQAVDKSEKVIDSLKALTEHAAFSYQNPNRVRSLLGTFAAANIEQFHRADGRGYEFITETLKLLNGVNPQVAARIITPLIQFSKFDELRQAKIKHCLQGLLDLPNLSKDLYEKVSRALS